MCEKCDEWCARKLAASGPTGRSFRGLGWVGAPRPRGRAKRTVETTAFLAMVRRMIRRAGVRVADADEIELGELVALEDELKTAIQIAVDGMRARGRSWAYIGSGVGIKRSAAQERWGHD